MKPIVKICTRRTFAIDEAELILPVILRITRSYKSQVDILLARAEQNNMADLESVRRTEEQVQKIVKVWQQKLRNLGALPKGMWLADFDSGTGYFCWKFPEAKILYWHAYSDGFSKRKFIKKVQNPTALETSQSEETEAPAFPSEALSFQPE